MTGTRPKAQVGTHGSQVVALTHDARAAGLMEQLFQRLQPAARSIYGVPKDALEAFLGASTRRDGPPPNAPPTAIAFCFSVFPRL